jgi:nucleotide-binding universal stress UspA family protein
MKAAEAKARIALKNILFATDFSPASLAALPFAKQIARRYGAKIYGVHVNPFLNYTGVEPNAWPAMTEAAERTAKEDAQRLDEELQGVEHEVVVGEGRVWEVLSSFVKDKEIDLVVVGTRGRTGIGRALLGSAAEEILRQAPCPVLSVGPHVKLWSDPAAEMHEILYATDLLSEAPAAAPYAFSLAQENQSHLVMLHVFEDPMPKEVLRREQLVASRKRLLEGLIPREAALWCEPALVVEEGVPAEKILDVAKRRRTDLIVLGAREVKGAGLAATHLNAGTAHKVLLQATCPVLTVRD